MAKIGKIVVWSGIGVLSVITLSVLANALFKNGGIIQKAKDKAQAKKDKALKDQAEQNGKSYNPVYPAPAGCNDNLPIKYGSCGTNVMAMQNALIKKYGNVLPIYGADGKWGSETEGALKAKGLPTSYASTQEISTLSKSASGNTNIGGHLIELKVVSPVSLVSISGVAQSSVVKNLSTGDIAGTTPVPAGMTEANIQNNISGNMWLSITTSEGKIGYAQAKYFRINKII